MEDRQSLRHGPVTVRGPLFEECWLKKYQKVRGSM